MRILAPLFLVLSMTAANAEGLTGTDWQLLAIDGIRVDQAVPATLRPSTLRPSTLRIEADGALTGRAPCNIWGSSNQATLPALALAPIRATRMACDRLAEEQAFFDALSVMTEARQEGDRHLILTGPDGRTMEFALDPTDSLTPCLTCPPKD